MTELTKKEADKLRMAKAFNQYRELLVNKLERMMSSDFKETWFDDCHTPQNINGREYDNVNSIILSLHSEKNGFRSKVYITQSQIHADNLYIKKGSKAIMIRSKHIRITDAANKEVEDNEYFKLPPSEKAKFKIETVYKYYPVFNIEQTNFPEKHVEAWETFIEKYSKEKAVDSSLERIIKENDWICDIRTSGDKDFGYSWIDDIITLPLPTDSIDSMEWNSSALHCMSQSTTHPSRLDKAFDKTGDERYVWNELTSSISSAYIARPLNIRTGVCSAARQYCSAWISELCGNPSSIYSLVNDLIYRNIYLKRSLSSHMGKNNVEQTVMSEPSTVSFEKTEGSSIIYAQGVTESGQAFKSPVYHRDQEYCYTIGSIIDGNLQTVYLEPQQIRTVEELRSYSIPASDPLIVVKTTRKSISFNTSHAAIRYMNKDYNADDVIKKLKENGINPKTISESTWQSLLMGQGIQLDKTKKAIFSIIKVPKGYDMRIANIAKKIETKSSGNEITNN